MSKQRNSNIGHMPCLLDGCREIVAVRRNVSGKLYCDCPEHGRITPNLPAGQEMMMDRANIWGPHGAPGDCPIWIAEQWSWGRVMREPEGRKPVNGAAPVNEPAPVTGDDPVQQDQPESGPAMPPPPPAEQPPVNPETVTEPEPEAEKDTENEDDFA